MQSDDFIRPRIKKKQTFSRTQTRVNVVDGGPVDCDQSPADGGLVGGFSFLFLCPGQDGRTTAIDLAVTKQPMPSSRKFTSRRPYLTAHPPKMEGIVQPPHPAIAPMEHFLLLVHTRSMIDYPVNCAANKKS